MGPDRWRGCCHWGNSRPARPSAGKGEAVRTASTDNGEGRLLNGFTLIRLGSNKTAALDPAKRDLLAKKEDLQSQIDILKYKKAALAPSDYRKQMTDLLVALAKVQAQIDGEPPK